MCGHPLLNLHIDLLSTYYLIKIILIILKEVLKFGSKPILSVKNFSKMIFINYKLALVENFFE